MKHRYQTRGVVDGAYKLFDIVSLVTIASLQGF